MSISVGNYEDIMTIYIFRMRSLNLVSSAKSVVLSFLCHNCWKHVARCAKETHKRDKTKQSTSSKVSKFTHM